MPDPAFIFRSILDMLYEKGSSIENCSLKNLVESLSSGRVSTPTAASRVAAGVTKSLSQRSKQFPKSQRYQSREHYQNNDNSHSCLHPRRHRSCPDNSKWHDWNRQSNTQEEEQHNEMQNRRMLECFPDQIRKCGADFRICITPIGNGDQGNDRYEDHEGDNSLDPCVHRTRPKNSNWSGRNGRYQEDYFDHKFSVFPEGGKNCLKSLDEPCVTSNDGHHSCESDFIPEPTKKQ